MRGTYTGHPEAVYRFAAGSATERGNGLHTGIPARSVATSSGAVEAFKTAPFDRSGTPPVELVKRMRSRLAVVTPDTVWPIVPFLTRTTAAAIIGGSAVRALAPIRIGG
jgi:hypothetical protein